MKYLYVYSVWFLFWYNLWRLYCVYYEFVWWVYDFYVVVVVKDEFEGCVVLSEWVDLDFGSGLESISIL